MKIKDAVRRTIASNIKSARIAANMTQADAADRLGITAQAVSNFERGVNGIENSLLIRMCEIYNASMSSILGEEEETPPSRLMPTEREIQILEALRTKSAEEQKALLTLLGISVD